MTATEETSDEQGGQPERRIGRILKTKVLGRRRVTLVVRPACTVTPSRGIAMKKLLADWVGKMVHVTLRATMPTPLQGVLLESDDSGIMLEMPKGRTFVPVTSILHVSLLDES